MNQWNCSHIIRANKFERNAPEIQNWWYKLFDMMETEAAIPPDKRLEVLHKVFPTKLLERILAILHLGGSSTSLAKKATKKPSKEIDLEETCASFRSWDTNMSDKKDRNEIGPNNPYLRFFNRRPDRAAIWHTLPPLSFDEMNLSQKAEAITESIAKDFVKWLLEITEQDSAVTLTVPKVLKLFEIGFNTHAAQSLQVRIRELLSVPTGVAILKNMPEMEKRSKLQTLIQEDVEASKKKERIFAFGRKLAPEEQVIPPRRGDLDKWLSCSRVPPRLESMAVVFQGITHLKSTRAFCEYLIANPNVKRPQYLIEENMFDPLVLKKSDHAFDNEEEENEQEQEDEEEEV